MAESLPPTRCRCAQTQRRDHKNQQKSAPSVALHYHAAASPPQSYHRLTGGAHAPTVEDQFSTKRWINANCRGGHALKGESVDAVSSFTLMWNIFEGAVCSNRAKIEKFKQRAEKIAELGSIPRDIEAGVQFWSERYVIDGKFNRRFVVSATRPLSRAG